LIATIFRYKESMITIARIASKKDIELGLAPSKQKHMYPSSALSAGSTAILLLTALKRLPI
jgi:hypothetical protein